MRLGRPFALAGGGEFRALRKISRVRRTDDRRGVGYNEFALFDAQQIAQRAFRQGARVAGADKVFVRLGQTHFNVQHVGLQKCAAFQTFSGHDEIGFKRVDCGFSGENELPRLEHGVKRPRNFEAQLVADGGTLLFRGLGGCLGGLAARDISSAGVERDCDHALRVEVVHAGNVVEVERRAVRPLVENAAESHHRVVRAGVA